LPIGRKVQDDHAEAIYAVVQFVEDECVSVAPVSAFVSEETLVVETERDEFYQKRPYKAVVLAIAINDTFKNQLDYDLSLRK